MWHNISRTRVHVNSDRIPTLEDCEVQSCRSQRDQSEDPGPGRGPRDFCAQLRAYDSRASYGAQGKRAISAIRTTFPGDLARSEYLLFRPATHEDLQLGLRPDSSFCVSHVSPVRRLSSLLSDCAVVLRLSSMLQYNGNSNSCQLRPAATCRPASRFSKIVSHGLLQGVVRSPALFPECRDPSQKVRSPSVRTSHLTVRTSDFTWVPSGVP